MVESSSGLVESLFGSVAVRDESQANRKAFVAEEDLASLVVRVTQPSDLVEVQHFPVPVGAAFDVQDRQPEMMNAREFCHGTIIAPAALWTVTAAIADRRVA
jgi:hypothetical protein